MFVKTKQMDKNFQTIGDRIQYLIDIKADEKITRFAKMIQMSDQSIRHVINQRNKPGFEMLEAIIKTFEDLNPRWLLTGEGEPFVLEEENKQVEEKGEGYSTNAVNLRLLELLDKKDEELKMLKKEGAPENNSLNPSDTQQFKKLKED